ncbi:MAG: polysaccharide pyruvyl transferase family protein, partial [Phycisphaerales bacterium]|nr:polysaccharide pyruvyl transferase family protein [Phycisphaerales bacterium]
TVFDFGRGRRPASIDFAAGPFTFDRLGAKQSRRIWQRETYWNIRWSTRLGGLGNPVVDAVRAADAVLDVSGGDSFTDLYGARRFQSIILPKRLALQQDRPLVLLPQTFGPFRSPSSRLAAEELVRASSLAWARDPNSFDVLRELLGNAYDAHRHREGVDLAFMLRPTPPGEAALESIEPWLVAPWAQRVCINISGLLYNDDDADRRQYGFRASYRDIIHRFIETMLRDTDVRLLLLPHVMHIGGGIEDDFTACTAVAKHFSREAADRITVAPAGLGPREAKWIIGEANWFCGTRMHSAIAALSSNVPTAAIAYSPKTLGVFATCGVAREVADPRHADLDAVLDLLLASYERRELTRIVLVERLTHVYQLAEEQLDLLLQSCWRFFHRHRGQAA